MALDFSCILKKANFINNKWYTEGKGKTLSVIDKYTQETIAELPMASEAQMEEAIEASVKGFNEIRKWSAGKRSEYLYKLIALLEKNKSSFVDLIIAESGKPRGYSTSEIDRCIATLTASAIEAIRFGGEKVPMDFNNGEGKTAFTKRFPLGPIACISPFNFPLNLALHKVGPALAAGCSIVLKPAPQSPLVCLAFAALCEEAGYPAGIINVLVADIPEAEKMVRDERLKMLSFTGSPQIGWHLKNICGTKKVALELGGNASVIVDSSADLKVAAKSIANGAFLYAGQICISTQRIFVLEDIFEEFTTMLVEEVKALKIGNPDDPDVIIGPVIDKGHLSRINTWVQEAVNSGAKVLTGGKIESEEHSLFPATLLTSTTKEMKVSCEEVFGPVAIIEKVSSFKNGIEKTNDSVFGLQSGVYTNRVDHMKLAHEDLEVGGVILNSPPGFRIDHMPYGGVKQSGLGREGIKYAMEEMTEQRLLVY